MATPNAVSVLELPPAELYELVYHLKQCNESAPEEMRRLLQEQPEFARAVAQAQLKLGMVRERAANAAPAANGVVLCALSVCLSHCMMLINALLICTVGRVE